MEKELASQQLDDFNKRIQSSISNTVVQANLNNEIRTELKKDIALITNQEKIYLNDSSNYFMIVFGLTC